MWVFELIKWVVIVLAAAVLMLALADSECSSRWQHSGLKSSWGPVQGCLVQMPSGRWLPDNRVRDSDLTPRDDTKKPEIPR